MCSQMNARGRGSTPARNMGRVNSTRRPRQLTRRPWICAGVGGMATPFTIERLRKSGQVCITPHRPARRRALQSPYLKGGQEPPQVETLQCSTWNNPHESPVSHSGIGGGEGGTYPRSPKDAGSNKRSPAPARTNVRRHGRSRTGSNKRSTDRLTRGRGAGSRPLSYMRSIASVSDFRPYAP